MQQRLPKIKENWELLKVKAKSQDDKLQDRLQFSIQDLVQAIESEQMTLKVKAEIAMDNLKAFEKDLSSMSSGSS